MTSSTEYYANRIAADGVISADELNRNTLPVVGTVLERWGAVRESSGSVSGHSNIFEISGLGEFEFEYSDADSVESARQSLLSALEREFGTSSVSKGMTAASDSVTATDVTRLEFGAASVDDIKSEMLAFENSSGSGSPSSGAAGLVESLGSSGSRTALLGAAAVAVGYYITKS